MSRRDQQKENNRSSFPETARIVDAFRAEFGDGVKLMCAEENGKKIGKFPPEPRRFSTVDQWLEGSRLVVEELERRAVKPELGERARRGRS